MEIKLKDIEDIIVNPHTCQFKLTTEVVEILKFLVLEIQKRDAALRFGEWYPETQFPALSVDEIEKIKTAVKTCGVPAVFDRLHGGMGRHLSEACKKIIKEYEPPK